MMLRTLKDDLRGSAGYFFPAAQILLLIGVVSAVICGICASSDSDTAYILTSFFDPAQWYCIILIVAAVLPAVLKRFVDTVCGDGAYFWQSLPVSPIKQIVSKLICTSLLFIAAAAMSLFLRMIYLFFLSGEMYKSYISYYKTLDNKTSYISEKIFSAVVLLLLMLCVQAVIEGAVMFASPHRKAKTLSLLLSTAVLLFTAGAYFAGRIVISKLSFIAVSEGAEILLGYSYGCAFFGVMDIVFTAADIILMSRRLDV